MKDAIPAQADKDPDQPFPCPIAAGPPRDWRLGPHSGWRRTLLTQLTVLALYFGSSKIILLLTHSAPQITLFWPPAGVAVAAVLLCGYRVLPAVFTGSLLVNWTASRSLAVSLGIAAGKLLALSLSLWLFSRFFDGKKDLRRQIDVIGFVLLAVLLESLIAASSGTLCLYAGQALPAGLSFAAVWHGWLLGNANGILVLGAPLLVWGAAGVRFASRRAAGELAALVLGLLVVSAAIFGPVPPETLGGKFLAFPFLILLAYRFEQYGATLALLATALAMIAWLSAGTGPLGVEAEDLPVLQVFVMTLGVTGLFLGATVAERREFERRLIAQGEALRRSNEELDDFSYIVSHDLKEPLRGLQWFSHFLLEDQGGQMGDEGRRKLRTIADLARQMGAYLDALLHYSRLGRTELAVGATDLNAVVQGVIDLFAIKLKESGTAVVFRQRLPTLVCDRVRIAEVFQNLVDNALKYADSGQHRIEIGYTRQHPKCPDEYAIYVRDYGIGIAPENLETIFKVFKRLHPKDAYGGGTGSGLMIAKKIIDQHHGRIWAESAGKGRGTTFFFTLPQEAAQSRAA